MVPEEELIPDRYAINYYLNTMGELLLPVSFSG
jgi:hypothetical protein